MAILVAKAVGGGASFEMTVDAEATILASTPSVSVLAITNDLEADYGWEKLYFYDGSDWRLQGKIKIESANPDMGSHQHSDRFGYNEYAISDKRLSACTIGSNILQEFGGFGVVRDDDGVEQFRIYLNDVLNDIVLGFRFRETEDGVLQTKPIGFSEWYNVNSGNSESLDLNGNPMVMNYQPSMGSHQPLIDCDGGTF